MKTRTHKKKPRTKAFSKNGRPSDEACWLVPSATEAAGPPLEGEALEQKVAGILCKGFRETAERKSMREGSQGAEHIAIEAAIVSPRVRSAVEPVAQAYALENAIAVLQLLFSSAKAALENEKPTAAQVTALKIIFETLVEKILERIGGNLWKEPAGLLVSSDYEKNLIENLLQTVRGQRTPVAEKPQRAPDSGQNDEKEA